jgi:thiamine pyrophosphate-dependent acetolactate synthase large subunit-like protein
MAEMNIVPSRPVYDAPHPSLDGIAQAASLLLGASRPMMLVGDRLAEDDALEPAVELAELMGLPVYQSRGAEVAFPTTHEQFLGNLSLRVSDHAPSCNVLIWCWWWERTRLKSSSTGAT